MEDCKNMWLDRPSDLGDTRWRSGLCLIMCVCVCVLSSGSIFECHWNLISQRHSEKKEEVSQDELLISTISANNTASYWLCCFMCPDIQPGMCFLRFPVMFSHVFQCCSLRFPFFFFLPRLCWFECSRMEWQQDKCTELWRTNRVNCPSTKCQAYNLQNESGKKKNKRRKENKEEGRGKKKCVRGREGL